MKKLLNILLVFFSTWGLYAQNVVKGTIVDNGTNKGLEGVVVSVKNSGISEKTDENGKFELINLPDGKGFLVIEKQGYETQNFPLNLKEEKVDLQIIPLFKDDSESQDFSTIVISDDELSDDNSSTADNISGLLQSSRDVYSRTAAFEWSSSFYRIRGLDSENAKVLINGIEMNKLFNGRPQWGNWGGLNDVFRNQEFSNGLAPSSYTFGGVLGSTHMSTRASEYREGGSISYASSNRSYVHRLMATYKSGVLEDGWSFAFSASRRMANEGFVDGTSYNAYSMFGTIEKRINDKHSLGFTSIYAYNKRGKSGPNTQEVFDIKGTKYNPYWGYQNGKMRNSRMKRIEEPIFILSHYWDISDKTSLNTNVAYQFGEMGNSRIDYMGGRLLSDGSIIGRGANPDPTYYRKLPSSIYKYGGDNIYDLYMNFKEDGQLQWHDLYAENMTGAGNSKYVLYEDRSDDKQLTANTILTSQITGNITLNGKLNYSRLESKNFAEVLDLLGGQYYLDIDGYGETFEQKQNDLLHPNRMVHEKDKFKYDYILNSEVMNGFLQAQFKYNKVDFYVAGEASRTTHQRDGLYQNGGFKDNSYGKSPKQEFINFSGKAGLTYKITGRHLLDFNGGYITKAPTLRSTFSNSRESNAVVDGVKSEEIMTFDASYIVRTPIVQARLTGYFVDIKNASETQFYFGDGLLGDNSDFVVENATGIAKQHIGAELGFEVKVTPTLKLKGASNFGQYTYSDNADLVLTSDDPKFSFGKREVFLKDYKLSAGPQKAYSFGFEYRDPKYWWISVTGNYLDETYVSISKLKRTSNFGMIRGVPREGYDEATARQLLAQERFDDYFTLNAVGGKSWRLKNGHFVGFFASISNILGKEYKSGGFEQARKANYTNLKEDKSYKTPLFGNKYWYGRGATYFVNVYYRF